MLSNMTSEPLNGSAAQIEDQAEEKEQLWHVFDLVAVRIILFVTYSVVFVFCFFGNLAVVLVTTFHHKMKSRNNFFLGQLAIANLGVALFCIYQRLSHFLARTWIFGELLWKMYHFVISLSQTASVLILVVTALERHCMIVQPFRSRWFSNRTRKHVMILLVWLLSSVLSLHKFHYVSLIENNKFSDSGAKKLICALDVAHFNHKLADVFSFILLFLAPLALISALYTGIALFLHKQEQQWVLRENLSARSGTTVCSRRPSQMRPSSDQTVQGPGPSVAVTEDEAGHGPSRRMKNNRSRTSILTPQSHALTRIHFRRKRSVVKLLVAITISFALCNLPFHVGMILQNYFVLYESDRSPWLELIAPLTFLLVCVNCAVNPFLHALFKRDFRRCLVQVLTCKHSGEGTADVVARPFRNTV